MYLALALSFSDDILARSATLLPPSSPRPGSVPLLLTLLNTFLDLTLLHDDAALARMQMEQILYALRGAGLPLFRNGRDTAADVRALVEEEPGKGMDGCGYRRTNAHERTQSAQKNGRKRNKPRRDYPAGQTPCPGLDCCSKAASTWHRFP